MNMTAEDIPTHIFVPSSPTSSPKVTRKARRKTLGDLESTKKNADLVARLRRWKSESTEASSSKSTQSASPKLPRRKASNVTLADLAVSMAKQNRNISPMRNSTFPQRSTGRRSLPSRCPR